MNDFTNAARYMKETVRANAAQVAAGAAAAASSNPDQDFFSRLQDAVAQLMQDQEAALTDVRVMRTLVQALLQNENQRLTAQEGADSPRVIAIRDRMTYNQVVVTALNSVTQTASIRTPLVQADGALIHGQVLDENGQAVEGLKVQVQDANGQPIAELGTATTDAAGYYSLPVTPDVLAKFQARAAGATIAVRSASGTVVSQASLAAQVSANASVFTPVTVNRAARVMVSPTPVTPPTPPTTPTPPTPSTPPPAPSTPPPTPSTPPPPPTPATPPPPTTGTPPPDTGGKTTNPPDVKKPGPTPKTGGTVGS